jgi:hypothetical protein
LRTGRDRLIERVAFIVAAQPARIVPKYEQHGLAKSRKVMSLSDLEAGLRTGKALEKPTFTAASGQTTPRNSHRMTGSTQLF